jgi:hypothetical protein
MSRKENNPQHTGVYTSDGFFSGVTADEVKVTYKKQKLKEPIIFVSAPASRRYFGTLKARSNVQG